MNLKEPAAIISVYSILNDQMMLNEITADVTLSFFSWIKSGMNGRQWIIGLFKDKDKKEIHLIMFNSLTFSRNGFIYSSL